MVDAGGSANTCRKCKGEIPAGAKKCMHCGSDQRNWFMRHKILTGILGLLLLGIVASALGGGGKGGGNAGNAASPAQPAANTQAEQPKAEPAENKAESAKIGSPFKVGDLVFTVTGASATKKLSSPLGNKSGNWVVVNVSVKNESKEAITIDSSFFKLLAKDGSAYETDADNLIYLSTSDNFFLAKINPNLSKKGQALFAVPDGVKPQDFTLQVQTGAFGTQTGVIALKK